MAVEWLLTWEQYNQALGVQYSSPWKRVHKTKASSHECVLFCVFFVSVVSVCVEIPCVMRGQAMVDM
jgi:hypothetical protein